MHEIEKARIMLHELEFGRCPYTEANIISLVFFPRLFEILDHFVRIFNIAILESSRKIVLVLLHQFGGPPLGGLQPGVRVDSAKFLLIVDPQVQVSRRAYFLSASSASETRPWSQKTRAMNP